MNNIGNIASKVKRWHELTERKKALLGEVGESKNVLFGNAFVTLTADQIRPIIELELEAVASELVPLTAALNRCCELLGIGDEPDIVSEF